MDVLVNGAAGNFLANAHELKLKVSRVSFSIPGCISNSRPLRWMYSVVLFVDIDVPKTKDDQRIRTPPKWKFHYVSPFSEAVIYIQIPAVTLKTSVIPFHNLYSVPKKLCIVLNSTVFRLVLRRLFFFWGHQREHQRLRKTQESSFLPNIRDSFWTTRLLVR